MAAKKPKRVKELLVVLLAAAVVLAGWVLYGGPDVAPLPGGQIAIHCIDVGQGDCTLIEAQGAFLLIDGGERGNEERVVKYLRARGVERLDYVVSTHPHSDHLGGLAYGVLAAFPCGTVIAPRLSRENTPTTNTYEAFLAAVELQVNTYGARAVYARPGEVYPLGDASFTVLAPLQEDLKNMNNNSVALRLDYGATAALFTGDAERPVENELVGTYYGLLKADLLHAGHHGSNTSSSAGLLQYAAPRFALIPVGVENTYGHPDTRTLLRLKNAGVTVCRTDIDGTVVFLSDGNEFWRDV